MSKVVGNLTPKKVGKMSRFNPKATNKSKQQKAVRSKKKGTL